MDVALEQAELAASLGEVPVGAVVVVNKSIIARAHNEVEARNDATAHAEILVLRKASEFLGSWRLTEASLYVTLEPCTMCIGAIINSRIASLYFGASDSRQGAVGSMYDLSSISPSATPLKVFSQLRAEESQRLLGEFFESRRASSKGSVVD